ncbi:hypothetical protein KO498_10850 [Lentibacter algarum]|uniref:hypothetical protein n=1 Tax=Lentibacter algarum TaxID=576131 RepID=UPI001C0712B9|nr:hypothetical protein [Lentibacter algarum]MBU2982305.1 hypothetical protein [Lentibacter algarum]
MNHKSIALSLLLLATACTPLSLYYKAGVPVQNARDAETRCEVQAARDVPPRIITNVIPGRHLPPRQVCNSANVCHTKPPVFIPPRYERVDANVSLRAKAVDLCMRSKGYQHIKLPACDPAIARQVPEGQTQRLPALSQNSCVVRSNGNWQIVTPRVQ